MRRPWLLLLPLLFVQGCGLGWLYMKIGDSKRIAGLKALSYDTSVNRFENAQKAFKTAIGYYNDAILYDEIGIPSVYHKLGLTNLMLTPADRYEQYQITGAAKQAFLKGLAMIRKEADRAGQTPLIVHLEQEVRQELQITADIDGTTPVTEEEDGGGAAEEDIFSIFQDENYAACHAGLGQMAFLDAVGTRDDKGYKVALFHFQLASRAGKKRRRKAKKSFIDPLFDLLNLNEIVERVPYIVEVAKIHNFLALNYRKRGDAKLQDYHFGLAKEALNTALDDFPNDVRVYSERARLAFYQGEFKKALSDIEKVIEGTDFYADKREFMILQGQIYNEMDRPDDALQSFQWVLDREETATEALIGRSRAFALKKDRNGAQADLTSLLEKDDENPRYFRQAGDVYRILGDRGAASEMYLKAYYLDKENIELVFELAKVYMELNQMQQAKDLFAKVIKINPTSEFATKARQFLKQ